MGGEVRMAELERSWGWMGSLFVGTLLVLCLIAAQLWRSDAMVQNEGIELLRPVGTAVAGPSILGDLAADRADIEFIEAAPAPDSFDLGGYAGQRTKSHTRQPVASQVDSRPAFQETPSLPPLDEAVRPVSLTKHSPGPAMEFASDAGGSSPNLPRATDLAVTRSAWPTPHTLLDELQPLDDNDVTRIWASQVRFQLNQLRACDSLSSRAARETVETLGQLVQRAGELLDQVPDRQHRVDLQRAAYALGRRVSIWKLVAESASRGLTWLSLSDSQPPELADLLADVERRLAPLPQRRQWGEYLRLDDLRRSSQESVDTSARRETATAVLLRMNAPSLTREQAALMREPAFESLGRALRQWTTEPVDYQRMLNELERYEREPCPCAARSVASDIERLRWNENPTSQMAELLDAHYRNANLRMAISQELVNRMLPQQSTFDEPVRQHILGARVRGRSRATSQLRVVLIPDPHQWRMGLEAVGNVRSSTESSKGPAVFFNQGDSRYSARKLLLIDRHGIQVSAAEAYASSEARLIDLQTDYDTLPLINALVRSIALNEYEQKAPLAKRRLDNMVAGRASAKLDDEVHQRLLEAEQQFKHYILAPLRGLNLNPTAMDLETTDQRLIARYRLAGTNQLGAHTPRPQAPGDSLLSFQLHESAMNNMLGQLRLEGRRTDLPTLYRAIATVFNRPDLTPPDDLPDDVTVTFADVEPIRLQFTNGEARLTLRIAELKSPDRRWKDFTIRAAYRPSHDRMKALLHREEYVQISGPELGFRDKLPLRAVFSAVLAKDRPIHLLVEQISHRPELEDLRVSQLTIQDGWIGLAIGPPPEDRTARRRE